VLDLYDDWVVLGVDAELAPEMEAELARRCIELGARGVYVKRRIRADLRRAAPDALAPPAPIAGEPVPSDFTVTEHGLVFCVKLNAGLSTGLFIDQRDNRRRVFEAARGVRMLNLFAYTCGFGVAAAVGGAAETVNVDVSRRALEIGRLNYAASSIAEGAHRFVAAEALAWLRRAVKRGERFDLVVLDPPSFGTAGRRTFRVPGDYQTAASAALALLRPGGTLLAVTNHRGTTRARLRSILRAAAAGAGRALVKLADLPPAPDFRPGMLEEPVSKSVLVTVE
jgi:23S rRNA (cytosine1962-C5)-methyltransferase